MSIEPPVPAPQHLQEPLVRIEDVAKHFPVRRGGRKVHVRSVDGVSLEVRRGEVLGLVGESGCGKSTLARLILNHIRPDRGSVVFDGQDIVKLRGERLRRLRQSVQMVFQDPGAALDPRMRVGQSLLAPLAQHRIGTAEEREAQARAMLLEVGLDASFMERYPRHCSGGQLQRIVVARALLLKPRFLICDEPTSALDASVRAQVLNLLNELRRRFDLTLLVITHDLRAMRHFCDRVAVMYLGRIVELAEVEEFFARPAHPYSRGLIAASLLELSGLETSGRLIKGEPPSPLDPPSGCHFHPRCGLAEGPCSGQSPTLERVCPGHVVACHFWERQEDITEVFPEAASLQTPTL